MKQWLLGLLIILAAVGATWFLMQPPEQAQAQSSGAETRTTNVNIAMPREGEVQDRLRAVGTSMARNSVDVVSEVDGRIVEINFDEGARVTEGQVLVTLDQRQARADLKVAEALLKDAEAKYQRATQLRNSNSVSVASVEELQASQAVARANLESAQTRLANLQIRAPFDGMVGLREVSVGAYLTAGQTITTLDSIDEMQVRFEVPQRFLSELERGQKVAVSAEVLGEDLFSGEVTELGTRIDPLSRTLTVQSRVNNKNGRLRPGQFVNVALTLETRMALLIPEQAVLTNGSDQYVFVVEDGEAKRRVLRLGSRQAGSVEVLEGLELDSQVVITGQDSLKSGDRVAVLEDDNALLSRRGKPDQGEEI